MKILSMTATFGKLEHETLTLEPGLNIIEAPNEWGKSTWCAFILAMLYGIDSRAHSATRQGLADKTRYDPWSGQLMSGRMELLWQQRHITIERSSTKRVAFREFRAFETETGLPLPELTADNCGQQLLGVEKEVFQRAGFIRLSQMPVTENESLRRRLHALVTTGDESGEADLLAERLNKLKNECRANRSHGLLPEAEQNRKALSEKLSRLEALQKELEELKRSQHQLEARQQALQEEQDALIRMARQARDKRISQLELLKQKRGDMEQQRLALQPPTVPEPFRGLSVSDGVRQVTVDHEVYTQACKERRRPWLFVPAVLPALLGLPALLIPHWSGLCLCLLGLLTGMLLVSSEIRRQKRAAATADALSKKYAGIPADNWVAHIRSVLTRQEEYRSKLLQLEESLSHLNEFIEQAQQLVSAPLTPSEEAPNKQQLQEYRQLLQQNHMQQGRCQGQMDALGSEEDLRAALAQCEARIQKLTDTLSAIELAQTTLQSAKQELQRRFAPHITRRAKALFGRMTAGRYNRLTLSEDFSLQVATEDEDVLRSSLWRSDGTVDQLYLALRLAVSAELTPNAPLVLDDALVRFDDRRIKAAMAVLSEESQSKQILLFTCQSREKQCL